MYQIDIFILEAERRVVSLVRWLMCWQELKNEKEKRKAHVLPHFDFGISQTQILKGKKQDLTTIY
jgi:hypothetical protein